MQVRDRRIPFTRNMKAVIKSGYWLRDEHMYSILQISSHQGLVVITSGPSDGFRPLRNEAIQIHLVSGNNCMGDIK